MATLEKIRSKSVLLVSIIFVALFLFIITIIDNPLGLFQDNTSAAKVDGEKIAYNDVTMRGQELQAQNQPQLQAQNEQRRLQGLPEIPAPNYNFIALNQLIDETLLKKECERLGIVVTDNEISNLIVGENANPGIVAAFRQRFNSTPDVILAAIENPAENGISQETADRLSELFKEFESDVENALLNWKFNSMMYGAINANKLDIQAIQNEANTTYTIAAVSRFIEGDEEATDGEVEQYYTDHREQFKLSEPTRHIRFVTVDIVPSPQDRANALAKVQNDLAQAQASETGMDDVTLDGTYIVENGVANADQLAASKIAGLKDFLTNAEPGAATILRTNAAYQSNEPHLIIAKLLSRENKVNSAEINQVILDGKLAADTVLARLNSGLSPEGLEGVAQVVPETLRFDEITPWLLDSLRTLGTGKYMLVGMPNSQQQIAVAVSSYGEPEDVYEYTTARYNINPTRETIEQLNSKIREFLISAPDAAAFNDENAIKQGLLVKNALISEATPVIDDNIAANFREFIPWSNGTSMADFDNIVPWAMNAKVGKVSNVITNNTGSRMAAVAVVNEYKDYIPVNFSEIQERLRMGAQFEKGAQTIINNVAGKGKTIADYAKLMDAARIDTISSVNLSDPRYYGLGNLRGHKTGDIVGPMRNGAQILVASVIEAKDNSSLISDDEAARTFTDEALRIINRNSMRDILLGKDKVEYKYLRFSGTGE